MTETSKPVEIFTKPIMQEIDRLLMDKNIYKIGNYGWLNENDADPDLLGHALWQTDSLSARYVFTFNAPNPPELKEWQKFLMVAGSDFEGLMEAARLSIGVALFQHQRATGPFEAIDDGMFQLHLMSSMMSLGAASDRIRDVFIAAAFEKSTKCYQMDKSVGEKRTRYATPFKEARLLLSIPSTANLAEEFGNAKDKLPNAAVEIHKLRNLRNEIVHDIATELGRREKSLIDNPPHGTADAIDSKVFTEELRKWKEAARRTEEEHRTRIAAAIDTPIKWYQKLVEFSSLIFLVENQSRL